LWIRIRASSTNIIDELGGNENTRASSAAELVTPSGGKIVQGGWLNK